MFGASADRIFAQRLGAIALAALLLRICIRLASGVQNYWTAGYSQYAALAQSLCAGHGYAFADGAPTAFRVPLYSMLVAATTCGSGSPWPLILVQALVSSATAVLAGLIAMRMAGSGAGLVAAAIYAVWPYGAWHDLSLQESGLHAFLAALATLLLLQMRERHGLGLAAAAGAALGSLLLTRATMLPFALCGLAIIALPPRAKARLPAAFVAGLAMLAVLTPWLAYSHRVTGAFGLGPEGGAALYAGNHPLTFSAYPQRSIDESRANVFASLSVQENVELARLGTDEVAQSEWFRAKALRNIAADPLGFLSGAMQKLWAAFGPLPAPRHGMIGNLGYAVFWVPLFGLALVGMVQRRRRWRDDLLLHAHTATFCVMTALFWAQTSHRSYLDAFLAAFASVAVVAMIPQRARIWLDA